MQGQVGRQYIAELKYNKKHDQSHLSNFFICVEGPIGVGKTTLAQKLHGKFNGRLILEGFEENPYLKDFYNDQGRYAFHTQIYFLQARYHQLSSIKIKEYPIISDYFFDKDSIFAHLNLFSDDLETYRKVFSSFKNNLLKPDLVIYLTADIDTLLQRIRIGVEIWKLG